MEEENMDKVSKELEEIAKEESQKSTTMFMLDGAFYTIGKFFSIFFNLNRTVSHFYHYLKFIEK